MKKGQQEALSAVLISGILIGVVGSVYFWGIPLVQKNKDNSLLETAETFMHDLDTKIKFVANNGGRDQLVVTLPGIIRFDGKIIELSIATEGTIYAIDSPIPLGRTSSTNLKLDPYNATIRYGVWGVDDPVIYTVKSTKYGETSYETDYVLEYIQLRNDKTTRDFVIELTGNGASGGLDRTIVIESVGDQTILPADNNGRTLIKSTVRISIV